jgi:hypothetical protein
MSNERAFRRIALGLDGAIVRDHPESFTPEAGAWGRDGCTAVQLATVDEDTLGEALTLAWQNSATARLRSPKK